MRSLSADLLAAALLCLFAGLLGPAKTAHALPPGGGVEIHGLDFSQNIVRYPYAAGGQQAVSDAGRTNATLTNATPVSYGGLPLPTTDTTRSGAQTHLIGATSADFAALYPSGVALAAPNAAVAVDCQGYPGDPGTGNTAEFGCGVYKDANNYVMAWYAVGGPGALVEARIGGVQTVGTLNSNPDGSGTKFPPAGARVALVLNQKRAVCCVSDAATGWRWKDVADVDLTATGANYDFTTSGNLTGWQYCHGVYYQHGSGSGLQTFTLANLRAGVSGLWGAREDFWITCKSSADNGLNGAPFLYKDSAGKLWALFTRDMPYPPGATGTTNTLTYTQPCSWGVWGIRLDTIDDAVPVVQQFSSILFVRGGHILDDQDGRLVWDVENKTFIGVINGWSTIDTGQPVDTYAFTSSGMSLVTTGVNTITLGSPLTVSNATSQYDFSFRYDIPSGLWHCVYAAWNTRTLTPGTTHFDLFYDTTPDITAATPTFTNVAKFALAADSYNNVEGPVWTRVNAAWRIVAAYNDAITPNNCAICLLPTAGDPMTLNSVAVSYTTPSPNARLNAPIGGTTPTSHFNVIQLPSPGGGYRYYGLAFDYVTNPNVRQNTWALGNALLLRAPDPISGQAAVTGNEFTPVMFDTFGTMLPYSAASGSGGGTKRRLQ